MRKLVFIFISILRLAHVSNYFFPALLPTLWHAWYVHFLQQDHHH